jgi:hypothetical protein
MLDARLPAGKAPKECQTSPMELGLLIDQDRLRYVSRTLGAQQGLYLIVFGAGLLPIELREVLPPIARAWSPLTALAYFAECAFIWTTYTRLIPRYYQRRFGHVELKEPSAKGFAVFLLMVFVLFFFGQALARRLDPMISDVVARVHMAISDPDRRVNLWPPFFWMTMILTGLRRQPGKIEFQRLSFLSAMLIIFTSVALYPKWHPDAQQLGIWSVMNAGWLGISLMVLGVYDHLTLLLLLPKRTEEVAK